MKYHKEHHICSSCGKEFILETDVEMKIICPSCGKRINNNDRQKQEYRSNTPDAVEDEGYLA